MKINSYNRQQYIDNKNKVDVAKKKQLNTNEEKSMNSNVSSMDSIEISESSKQLNLIRNRIDTGYYDSPQVLEKVAEKILYTINTEA